jgi:hypothetical protein
VLAYAAKAVDWEGGGAGVVRFSAGLGWRAVESCGALGVCRVLGCAVMGFVVWVVCVDDGCSDGA